MHFFVKLLTYCHTFHRDNLWYFLWFKQKDLLLRQMLCVRTMQAFTMIEVMIAITILAVISAAVLPNLRNFNRAQEVEINRSFLYDKLRLAQSRANSSIVCPGVNPNLVSLDISWAVVLKTDGLSLEYRCIDKSNAQNITYPGVEDFLFTGNGTVTMSENSCPTGAMNNAKVRFSARSCPAGSSSCQAFQITCGDPAQTPYVFSGSTPFTITLQNGDVARQLSITAGGAIVEN